jgi:hypothetical protein
MGNRTRTVETLLMGVVIVMSASCSRAEPRLRVLRGEGAVGANVIVNPGFEQGEQNRATGWIDWQKGYRLVAGEGRNGSNAVACMWQADGEQYGATQNLTLSQERPTPIVVRAWSKAQDVSGSADSNYSLYCDLEYVDGTPLWGQKTPFATGTHDWEQREVMIVPAKPVASIAVHCLFRGHRGQVWFDDVELYELKAAAGTAILDGVPVVPEAARIPGAVQDYEGGGASVRYAPGSGSVSHVRIGERDIAADGASGGFLARDVAANSDFHGFRDGKCGDLDLELEAEWTETPEALELSGTVRDTTRGDRAVTLLFALPVAARGGQWGAGIGGSRSIGDSGEYTDAVPMGTGATGTLSQYPFSCVYGSEWGIALGIDLREPAQYRLAYNADTQQYFVAFDFGLVPETEAFPSAAPFRIVIYATDPAWGFRSAAERYYAASPLSFLCRSKRQGIWMPFSKISEV